jgi:hypothetical protein
MTTNEMAVSLKTHYELLGVPKRRYGMLVKSIMTWKSKSGTEWTITRLKALKGLYLDLLAGRQLSYPKDIRILKDEEGLPRGPFGFLFSGPQTPTVVARNLSILNSYYLFKVEGSTYSRKVEEATEILKQPYLGLNIESVVPEDFKPFEGMGKPIGKPRPSLAAYFTSKPETSIKGLGVHPRWIRSLVETSQLRLPYEAFLDASGIKDTWLEIEDPGEYYGAVIKPLNEPGGKVRLVAMPLAELQVVFRPFHRSLESILRGISEDCTFDQQKGADFIADSLSEGMICHSIDLKSATDLFPVVLQLRFLDGSGIESEWIEAFRLTTSMPVEDPKGDMFKYSVGQPMGLYGSFPLLALGQHGLIRLAGYLSKVKTRNRYVVLGDDVVIIEDPENRDDLASTYRYLLNQFAIPISESKSITSNKVAEFAGFTILPGHPLKGVKPKSGKSLLTPEKLWSYSKVNPKAIFNPLVPKWKRDHMFPWIFSPVENDGMGLNPDGLSLQERDLWYDLTGWYQKEYNLLDLKVLSCSDTILASLKRLEFSFQHFSVFSVQSYIDDIEEFYTSFMPGLPPQVGMDHMSQYDLLYGGRSDGPPQLYEEGIRWIALKRKYAFYHLAIAKE